MVCVNMKFIVTFITYTPWELSKNLPETGANYEQPTGILLTREEQG